MITFDIPVITTTQHLANLCFQMMKQTAELHTSGQYVSFHDLPLEQVQSISIEGTTKQLMEVDIPAMGSIPARCYMVATLYVRFDKMHISEMKFFSTYYEKH